MSGKVNVYSRLLSVQLMQALQASAWNERDAGLLHETRYKKR